MLAFDKCQHTVVTQIQGAAYLAAVTVTEDDGRSAKEKEWADALNAKGVSIQVFPPVDSLPEDQADAGIAEVETAIAVFVCVNPERNNPDNNPDAANLDLLKMVSAAVEAVLAYRGPVKNPNDLFRLSHGPKLDTFDAGLARYFVVFGKRCVL